MKFQTAKCVNCQRVFGTSSARSGNHFVCGHCGTRYPLLDGKVPVFFSKPYDMLGTFYWSYEQFFKGQAVLQGKLRDSIARGTKRAEILRSIDHAIGVNNGYLRSIQLKLREFITIEDVLTGIERDYPAGYSKLLHYLRRDWSGLPESEKEITTISDCIKKQLALYASDRVSAFVTGAGMGRIAFELAGYFEHVYAIDDSPTMVCSFYRLLENNIDFYQVNVKKVFREADIAIRLKASLPMRTNGHAPLLENVTYFLGDALQSPVPDASQTAVISVYFTDVFPLRQYLSEVMRVLKPGGLFIHFGPLEYHFSEIEQMLSVNEVRHVLKEHGFTILHEEEMEDFHLTTAETMAQSVYCNWVFTARKEETAVKKRLLPLPGYTPVALADGVEFEIHGQLYPAGEKIDTIVISKSGSRENHKVTRAIFELLKLVNGGQTIDDLTNAFSTAYEVSPALRTELTSTISDLVHKGILVQRA